ncbi:MAG: Actin-like protein arp9 (SWI/SNF complex component arp9) [Piccolia ochrophora]|nr:MAG: Actin-like protein arp9 (SWI/SNF complex component arp9) [Piccolia ochrophora]
MPAFKDEHVLIIAPGSQTTLAQLGLPESFTPARVSLPTRMFPAEKKGEWEPYRIRERKRPAPSGADQNEPDDGSTNGARPAHVNGTEDVEMADGANDESVNGQAKTEDDEDHEYEEDFTSDEGAVYPLTKGRVTDWSCFLAFLNHVRNILNPPLHTPILLIAQASWTAQDVENVAQFMFEKFKTPGLCLMDSAMATCYAFGVPTATVIDVGYDKADVTAVSEFIVHDVGRGVAVPGAGGEAMTQRILELLEPKGWTKDMCEQLKRSNICEILGKDVPLPGASDDEKQDVTNPASAASTGAVGSGPGHRNSLAAQGGVPRGPGPNTDAGEDGGDGDLKEVEDNEGILDVATIVSSGKTAEFLARKEREKAERAAAKKGAADAAAAATAATTARIARLPNSRREKNTFTYEERRQDDAPIDRNENGKRAADDEPEAESNDAKRQKTPENEPADAPAAPNGEAKSEPADPVPSTEEAPATEDTDVGRRQQEKAARKEEKRRVRLAQEAAEDPEVKRRELEVGVERFMAATGGVLEVIADAVHRTVLAVEEVGRRGELWDSLIIVGNGSRVRGFKDALVSTLTAKYLISPSSATIFTSELPSNLSTPLATGANTPQPQQTHQHVPPTSSHVNPLLLAATTASQHHTAAGGAASATANMQNPPSTPHHGGSSTAGGGTHHHHHAHSSHGQTPTSIKLTKPPEYFPEWKDAGFDEAAFLGAQVAAKVVFIVDQGVSKGFMSRPEYNEMGPQAVHGMRL